ncbi:MAG: hypothetical protein CVT88_02055 [Candidatus Altiarchaeales archaeon HGW-Altiarchaeales-1]|nr:MAG: hypothetical protein CVT88_02055 [Candidatus Altiarchaeales archaeon HGW-Altiarchaeales-1]
MYCLDASVVVNAFMADEEGYEYSRKLLEKIRSKNIQIVVPQIILPEISAAIARKKDDENLAISLVKAFVKIPDIKLIHIDENLAMFAAEIAAKYRTRGADSLYIAVALTHKVTLITLDKEQKDRGNKILKVITPKEELSTDKLYKE